MVKEGKLCHGRCVTSDHGPVGGCRYRDDEGGFVKEDQKRGFRRGMA